MSDKLIGHTTDECYRPEDESDFEIARDALVSRYMIDVQIDQGVSAESFRAGADWAYEWCKTNKVKVTSFIMEGPPSTMVSNDFIEEAEALAEVLELYRFSECGNYNNKLVIDALERWRKFRGE